jgi:GAF domain-containing protein
VPQVADWCIVDIVEGAEIRRVAVAAADDERQRALEDLQRHFPPTWDSPQPAAQALREGGAVILEEFDGAGARRHRDRRRAPAILETLDPHSAIALPLIARGEKLGAITFAWSQTGRRYSDRDLPLMEDLASRAALAVDNARLYARERATGDQLAFLAEMSSLLASSLDYETTLANVAQLVVPQFADWCAGRRRRRGRRARGGSRSSTRIPRRRMGRPLARLHPPDGRRGRGHGPCGPHRRADALPRISDELLESTARDPEQLEVLRELGMASAMVVPMKARGRTLGALMLVSSDPCAALRRRRAHLRGGISAGAPRRRSTTRSSSAVPSSGAGRACPGVRRRRRDARRRRRVVQIWNAAAEVIDGPSGGRSGRPPGGEAIPGWAAIETHVPVSTGPALRAPRRCRSSSRRASAGCRSRASLPGGTVYAFRDLTEERRVERLKSEFVSTISHELRTPLAAIYGAALTLRREEPALEAQREGLLDVVAPSPSGSRGSSTTSSG